ncbi:MAG TPA: M48 family metalloprotease [Myxococcota bacterium]
MAHCSVQRSPERARITCALAAALSLSTACTTVVNPVTGRPELTTMSPQQEIKLGAQAAVEVEQQMGFVDDAKLQSYVAQLGARLAQFSPRQDVKYEFHAVDMEETNAFALPGGYVYVSRGLLALANTEDELAGVVGHEIGHVAARHAAQRQTRGQAAGIGAAIATLGAMVLGGGPLAQSVGELVQTGAQGWLASYGRDQERQSDEIGQKLAAQAGYDPAALGTFLGALGREQELKLGQKRKPTFLDTHPSSDERERSASARAGTLVRAAAAPIAKDRGDFVRRTEGLMVGPDPAQGIFRDALFLHPDLDLALTFPRDWQTQNSPEAVVAKPAEGNALLVLRGVPKSEGADARSAAQKFLSDAAQQNVPAEDGGQVRVGSARGYRVRALVKQSQLVEVTYFAHGDSVLAFQAMALQNEWDSWSPAFERTQRSFRRLTGDDRALIAETRLALVPAKAGETLEQVSRRSDNRWSAAETALYNGLRGDERLASGFLVKIGRARPYVAKPKPAPALGP